MKSKKFVLAGLVLLAAITMVLLPLAGCKTEVDTSSPQQEQTKDTNDNAGTGDNDSTNTEDNTSGGGDSGTGGGDTGDNPSAGNDGENGTVPETTSGTVPETAKYTVSFDANGGTFVDGKDTKTEMVESGQKATEPIDPTKANWVFAGWYTLKDDGETLADTAYSFDTPVAGDIILYAAWNGRVDGTIVLRNKVMSKTSEVQVLSTKVTFASLDKDGVDSKVFISDRKGEIQPFVMGRYEVTQQLYFAVMGKWGGTEPSNTYGLGDEYPAYYVSWYDAVVFCNELSELMGLEPVYSKGGTTDTSGWGEVPTSSKNDTWKDAITCDFTKSGYRLPTEAEWELAARGGKPEEGALQYTYAGSNTIDEVAWYSKNSGNEAGEEKKTHQVGTKAANGLNLHDMSGNVWEWCWDWWASSITEATPFDGAAAGSYRVYRGGGWSNVDSNCTVSGRSMIDPYSRGSHVGFRLVRSAN